MEKIKVSIIVLNHNGKRFLNRCFSSLRKLNFHRSQMEIIMVDNNSTDGSIEFMEENFPEVKLLKLNKNYGFAEGNNKALNKARGEYLAFLNNDAFVHKDWLGELLKTAEDKTIGACASKILFAKDKKMINSVGLYWTIFGTAGEKGIFEKDGRMFDSFNEVLAPSGAAFLVKKKIFKEVGSFDSDYFIYVEDLDLGWKIWNHGYRVVYVPTAKVYHYHGGAVTAEKLPRNHFLNTKNCFMTLVKNADIKNLLKIFPIFILQRILLSFYYGISHKPKISKAILSGLMWSFKNFRKIYRKRLSLRQTNKIDKFLYGPYFGIHAFRQWQKYQIY